MKNKKNQNKANKMKKVFLNLIYVFLGILLFKTLIPNLSEGFETKTETQIPKIIKNVAEVKAYFLILQQILFILLGLPS